MHPHVCSGATFALTRAGLEASDMKAVRAPVMECSALVLHSDLHAMRHRGWLRDANAILTQALQMELHGFLDQLLCLPKGLPDCNTPGQVRT